MLIFLDSEFTGLGQRWPRLISIGLISEDGLHQFYAELTAESYMEKCDPWVKENVLPFLEGCDCLMQPDELHRHLTEWIEALGAVQIATDSDVDFDFMRAILDRWPANLDTKRLKLGGSEFAEALNMIQAENNDLHQHHALDDAKANRLAWLTIVADCKLPKDESC